MRINRKAKLNSIKKTMDGLRKTAVLNEKPKSTSFNFLFILSQRQLLENVYSFRRFN